MQVLLSSFEFTDSGDGVGWADDVVLLRIATVADRLPTDGLMQISHPVTICNEIVYGHIMEHPLS
jgi:hypothetical protein